MREIKFKALFKHIETGKKLWQMVTVNCSVNVLGHVQISDWMQYTGLKDKNCVEVFENDIVNLHGFIGQIKYEFPCWYIENKDGEIYAIRKP